MSRLAFQLAVSADQGVGRAVVGQLGLGLALELGDDLLRQHLAELDAPLIEGVDLPDRALREHAVLVERHQLAQRGRRQAIYHDGVGGAIALEHAVRNEPIGRAFRFHLLGRLAEGERRRLREHVGEQQVVMAPERVERLREGDEVAGNEPGALMDQLIERVLAVGAGLAPVDRSGRMRDRLAVERHVLAVALHGQLLEIGRETLEILLVGQHCDGLCAEEVVVPDADEAHEHRQVAVERRRAEVLVDGVEAVQHGAEVVGADRQHGGEADGGIHRIAAADPVPELEHVGGVDAELGDLLGVSRDRDEMLGDRLGIAPEPLERPFARAMRISHRLERREGLGGDDEQRFRRIEIARRLDEIGAVDIGDEAERAAAVAVVFERLVGHRRSEIGAADADIHDGADRLAGVAGPSAAAHAFGERGHLVEHRMHLRHHVLAVDHDRGASRRAQRDVQHGPVLGDVDLLAVEHRVDAGAQPGSLRELDEKRERLVGDAVLRVVEIDAGRFRRHPLAPRGVVGEQLAQMHPLHGRVVFLEVAPHPARAQLRASPRPCSHLRHPFWSPYLRPRRLARDVLCGFASCHRRKPPRNALAFSPARQCGGSTLSLRALPPPITVSSGSSAAIRRVTTSATCSRHFFLPCFSRPAWPT